MKTHEPGAQPLQSALCDATPAMRCCDEDHPADFRTRLEDQSSAKQVAIVLFARELRERVGR